MQHCSISVTLWLTYTDDRCVKKLVRPWQFTAAVCFLYPSNTIDRPSTVLGKSTFRCDVMIWRALDALKCLSHFAEDASAKYAGGSKCIDPWPIWPIEKTDPFDPLTHRPIVYSALPLSLPAENLPFSQSRSAVDSLPPSGITPRTVFRYRFVWANRFLFSQKFVTITFSGFVPCARLNWLTVIF